jgi:AMP nucleosidase
MNHKAASLTPEQALNQLELQYERSVNALRKAIGEYINHSVLPDDNARAKACLFIRSCRCRGTARTIKR